MKAGKLQELLLVTLLLLWGGSELRAQEVVEFNIEELALVDALLAFSAQSGVQLVIPDRILAGRMADPLQGSYSADEALRQLLQRSGLVFEFVDDVTAIVRGRPADTTAAPAITARRAPAAAKKQRNEVIENIVVTGARIPRSDTSPASPVTILSVSDFRFADSRNSEATINLLPQVIPDGTATTNNTGPNNGSSTIDLRGFGAARTLVLLDSRRVVGSTIDTTVDINSIPAGMLERVDVVTGGASAAYGSDALAGVVNFILRDDYVGAELEAGYGLTDFEDGARYSLNGAWGSTFNSRQTHVSGFFDLSRRDPVREADRPLHANDPIPRGGQLVNGGSRFLPGGILLDAGAGITLDAAGLTDEDRAYFAETFGTDAAGNIPLSESLRFSPNGDPLPFADPDDRYLTTPFIYLQLPQEREVGMLRASHTLPSAVTLYGDLLYSQSVVDRALAPVAFRDLRVPETSPFISPRLATILAQQEAPDADNYFTMEMRVPESGSRTRSNRRRTTRVVLGADGQAGDSWSWDAWINVGRMILEETEGNAGQRSRVQSALGCPVAGNDADGNFIPDDCPITPVYPDGVRINPFGVGNISLAELAFMLADPIDHRTDVTQVQASASMVGEAIDLPAGPIGWAWGLEYRDEYGDFTPDGDIPARDIIGSLIESPTQGSFSVFEAFGEMYAPLVLDESAGTALNLNAAVRLAHYSTVGNAFNWKFGIEWTPQPQFRLRAQYQSAIRAPNIEELFTGERQTFVRFTDPCASAIGELRDACIAVGLSPGQIDALNPLQRQIPSLQSGNAQLREERAHTFTGGIVYAPAGNDGIRLTLDYYDISVDNAISLLGASESVNRCLAVGEAQATACGRIRRDANGEVTAITRVFENLTWLEREGIDLESRYAFDALGGTVDLRLLGTWTLGATSRATPFSREIDCAGFVSGSVCGRAFPELKTRMTTSYTRGDLTLNLGWQHVGAVRDAKVIVSDIPPVRERIGAQDYFDIGLQVRANDWLTLRAGVLNLNNEEAPLFESQVDARTDPATYDVVGRRYYLAARITF